MPNNFSSTESLDTIREVDFEQERGIGNGATVPTSLPKTPLTFNDGNLGFGTSVVSPDIGYGTSPLYNHELHGIDTDEVIASLHLPEGARIKNKEVVILNGQKIGENSNTSVNHHLSGDHHEQHIGHNDTENVNTFVGSHHQSVIEEQSHNTIVSNHPQQRTLSSSHNGHSNYIVSQNSHQTASTETVVTSRSSASAHHTVSSTGTIGSGVSVNEHVDRTLVTTTDNNVSAGSLSAHHLSYDELEHRLHESHEHQHLDGIIHGDELPTRDDFFELISTVVIDWQINEKGLTTDFTVDTEIQIASLGEVDAIVPLSYLDIVEIETITLEPEWKVFDEVTVINTIEYEYEEKVKGPPKVTTIEETEVETRVTTDVETEQRKWKVEEEIREAKAIDQDVSVSKVGEGVSVSKVGEGVEAAANHRSVYDEVKVETVQRNAVSEEFKANRNRFEQSSKDTGPSSPLEYQQRHLTRRQYVPASHHRPHAAEYKVVGSYVNTKETVYKPTRGGVDETPILGQNAYWTSASSPSNVTEFNRISNAKYELKQTTVEPPTSRQIGVFAPKKTLLFDDDKSVDDTHELFRAKAFAHRRQEIQQEESSPAPTRRSLSSQHFASGGSSTGRVSIDSTYQNGNSVSTPINEGTTIYSTMKTTSNGSTSNGNPFEAEGYVSQYSNKGANYSFTASESGQHFHTTESHHTSHTSVQHSSSGEQTKRTGSKYVIAHDSPAIRSYTITSDK